MSIKSAKNRYGAVAIIIHWLSVLLIIALLATGFRVEGMEETAAKSNLLRLHIPLGITILILTVFRIGWWLVFDHKPAPIDMPIWQNRLSQAVHILFYVTILGMIASGIGMIILSGAVSVIFNGSTGSLPDFWDYKPRLPHAVGGRAILLLLVFHAGAAFYHQFIKRDHLLSRMWYQKGSE